MLIQKLKEYANAHVYPMHMPGHKRSRTLPHDLPYDIDITEIHGFDDMHNPTSILLEIEKLAARIYGSKKSFPLINGSTAGILSAIGAHTKRGDKILVAEKCHWSVTNAADLFGLIPIYIASEIDKTSKIAKSISPEVVEETLRKNPEVRLVVITSPSYEGVISDIRNISAITHSYDIPLFTDSAHGAHLGFSKMFPENAVQAGSDITVMSLHKTLPAMTQCSLLHICSERADICETKRLLSILQTSSPSYVLMSSIDSCLHMLDTDKDYLFEQYEQNLLHFDQSVANLKKLSLFCRDQSKTPPGVFAYDPGKLVITTKNTAIDGFELSNKLRSEYAIELERACEDYAIAMTSICDSTKGFDMLSSALIDIDNNL
ncbi:MAG: aminotransferase class I/II-fold pyridoxal phosphate-dependent enzyme [Oscillospiraceae bacterium]|nr:aminotransferase class I/II-fold pyridoxal phosphate-dependent enzyme [Oscillospiraceae bacterium]